MELIAKIGQAFDHGGIWMWPIALFQVVSIAIVLERFVALYVRRGLRSAELAGQFEEDIKRGELDKVLALSLAQGRSSALARAVTAGTKAAARFGGREEIQGKMDEVLLKENASLDNRIGFLSMLGNVATLTGLLGTITGMIGSFAAVAFASPTDKAALLARGISEAMNCTAYGLIVAIPALLLYGILQNRANKLADDLNQSALKVFNWLSFAYEPVKVSHDNKGAGKTPEREWTA